MKLWRFFSSLEVARVLKHKNFISFLGSCMLFATSQELWGTAFKQLYTGKNTSSFALPDLSQIHPLIESLLTTRHASLAHTLFHGAAYRTREASRPAGTAPLEGNPVVKLFFLLLGDKESGQPFRVFRLYHCLADAKHVTAAPAARLEDQFMEFHLLHKQSRRYRPISKTKKITCLL